jgi:phosphate-selective porin OprO and OprP
LRNLIAQHRKIRTACLSAALPIAALAIPTASAQQTDDDQPPVQRAEPAFSGLWTFDDWRPTASSPDGRFTMSIRARLQLDAAIFDQEENDEQITPQRNVQFKALKSGVLTRRAYLGVEGRLFGNFWYEYRMDFGGTRLAIANPVINLAHVSYNFGEIGKPGETHFRVNAGIIKPIFTNEDATSSASLLFLERAAVVNVATSAYGGGTSRLGIDLTLQEQDILRPGDNLVVSGAFTGQNPASDNTLLPSNTNYESRQILGRVAYRLWSDGLSNVQIGGSASRILKLAENPTAGDARTISLQDQPEVRVDGSRLVGTGAIAANGGATWGLESAANIGSFYIAGELYRLGIARNTGCTGCVAGGDPAFSGGYVEASWILTGEAKVYVPAAFNNNVATFANPRVDSPFSLERQSWGAWEIAARYSDLDLNWRQGRPGTACLGALAGCVRGGDQKIWTLGLNWYPSNNVRVLLDYVRVDVSRLNGTGQEMGQRFSAVATRLQFTN